MESECMGDFGGREEKRKRLKLKYYLKNKIERK